MERTDSTTSWTIQRIQCKVQIQIAKRKWCVSITFHVFVPPKQLWYTGKWDCPPTRKQLHEPTTYCDESTDNKFTTTNHPKTDLDCKVIVLSSTKVLSITQSQNYLELEAKTKSSKDSIIFETTTTEVLHTWQQLFFQGFCLHILRKQHFLCFFLYNIINYLLLYCNYISP